MNNADLTRQRRAEQRELATAGDATVRRALEREHRTRRIENSPGGADFLARIAEASRPRPLNNFEGDSLSRTHGDSAADPGLAHLAAALEDLNSPPSAANYPGRVPSCANRSAAPESPSPGAASLSGSAA